MTGMIWKRKSGWPVAFLPESAYNKSAGRKGKFQQIQKNHHTKLPDKETTMEFDEKLQQHRKKNNLT